MGSFSSYGDLPPLHEPIKNGILPPELFPMLWVISPTILEILLSIIYLPRGVPVFETRTSFL